GFVMGLVAGHRGVRSRAPRSVVSMAFAQLLLFGTRKAPLLALALVMAVGFAAEAAAESAFCRDVRADYERAARNAGGGRAGGDAGKIERQLAAAQADAKRSGCRRVLFGKPGKNCPAIMSRINQLQRDLARARSGG